MRTRAKLVCSALRRSRTASRSTAYSSASRSGHDQGQEKGHARFFDEGNSFPSGHAVNAWALATVVAYEYKERPLVRYGAYVVATAVSLSRFGGRTHFLSDVLVGSAIGYGIGRYVYKTHHDPNLDKSSSQTTADVSIPTAATYYDALRPPGAVVTG